MRGKNVLTPYDKLKGWVLLFSTMSVVPSLKIRAILSSNLLVMQISCQWIWKFRGLHMHMVNKIVQVCSSDAWSLELFSKKKLKRQVPQRYAKSYQSHMSYSMKNPLHICCLIFCWVLSNCVTLERCFSCFLDHKHAHVSSNCYIPTLGIGTTTYSLHIISAPCHGDLSRRTFLK